tara:strand:+ start:138 stop:392 length:255 start_codon:yes stop_codon:yes gene_type:complete
MLETGFNKSLAVPMIRGESGFQVPKATPQSGIEQTKNDLIRVAKDRKSSDLGIKPNLVPGTGPSPSFTPKGDASPSEPIVVKAY